MRDNLCFWSSVFPDATVMLGLVVACSRLPDSPYMSNTLDLSRENENNCVEKASGGLDRGDLKGLGHAILGNFV